MISLWFAFVFDDTTNKAIKKILFKSYRTGDLRFSHGCEGLVIGSNNDVYVGNAVQDQIQVYDSHLNFQYAFPYGEEIKDGANKVFMDKEDNLYICGWRAESIGKYDLKGKLLATGSFKNCDLTVSPDGNIYEMHDFPGYIRRHQKICRFRFEGNALQKILSFGDYGKPTIRHPLGIQLTGVHADEQGNVFVGLNNGEIHVYNTNGTFLYSFRVNRSFTSSMTSRGDFLYLENRRFIQKYAKKGKFISEFKGAKGYLALDKSGNIYTCGQHSNTIQVFSEDGKLLKTKGPKSLFESILKDPEHQMGWLIALVMIFFGLFGFITSSESSTSVQPRSRNARKIAIVLIIIGTILFYFSFFHGSNL